MLSRTRASISRSLQSASSVPSLPLMATTGQLASSVAERFRPRTSAGMASGPSASKSSAALRPASPRSRPRSYSMKRCTTASYSASRSGVAFGTSFGVASAAGVTAGALGQLRQGGDAFADVVRGVGGQFQVRRRLRTARREQRHHTGGGGSSGGAGCTPRRRGGRRRLRQFVRRGAAGADRRGRRRGRDRVGAVWPRPRLTRSRQTAEKPTMSSSISAGATSHGQMGIGAGSCGRFGHVGHVRRLRGRMAPKLTGSDREPQAAFAFPA